MTIGIYCIENIINNKKYIGKSITIEHRFWAHKYWLTKETRSKDCNRYLYHAVQKYGIENFKFYIVESFDSIDEDSLKEKELLWMDTYKTCNRDFGYNLRRDSSTSCITSQETLELQSIIHTGENNANFGNKWTDEQKSRMSEIAKARHEQGFYKTEKCTKLRSDAAKLRWSDPEKVKHMAKAVSKAKEKYLFFQFDLNGVHIRTWSSLSELIEANPQLKWQNIYAACNGNKSPRYKGYLWARMLKTTS